MNDLSSILFTSYPFQMHRTNTSKKTTFSLPGPNEVTFTFLTLAEWKAVLAQIKAEGPQHAPRSRSGPPARPDRAMRVSIPAGSKWKMVFHWHPSQIFQIRSELLAPPSTCVCVTCVEGRMSVGAISIPHASNPMNGGVGTTVPFQVGDRVSWGNGVWSRDQPVVVDFIGNQIMWRNVCSVILDRDKFPLLHSTPWWFKLLFSHCSPGGDMQQKLLDRILALQIQCIYQAHDFHVEHGQFFPILWFWDWRFKEAPSWAWMVDMRGQQLTAAIVMWTIRWACRLFLGMKGEYAEYSAEEVLPEERGRD